LNTKSKIIETIKRLKKTEKHTRELYDILSECDEYIIRKRLGFGPEIENRIIEILELLKQKTKTAILEEESLKKLLFFPGRKKEDSRDNYLDLLMTIYQKATGKKAGISGDKTKEGNFIGHIVIGDRWIREKIRELREKGNDFNKDLENFLCHMILSHHGKYEFGSPRMPKIVEACVLFQSDLMDSQVKHYIQNLDENRKNTDDDWTYIWDSDLGSKRPMYLGDV